MDPEVAALLPTLEAETARTLDLLRSDIEGLRRKRDELAAPTRGTGPAVRLQEDRVIDGPGGPLNLHIIIPEGPKAAYLHIHGGGWVLGSEKNQDPMLRRLATEAGVAVVSVGYRLAPEHPYPAGLDDCMAASRWVEASMDILGVEDAEAIYIGGESAGANLAVATLLRRRDELEAPFRGAVLTFGVFSAIYDLPSMKAMWDRELVLSGPIMSCFSEAYAAGRDLRHPYISPLYADLKGLPPAIFSVGTLDHLYSDTKLMSEAWQAAGNECVVHEYVDGFHGFTGHPIELARRAHSMINAWLKSRVAAPAGIA
ncbi:MAG: alpha/beta hydrolase [Anaerolinea sp.]|nr:alpha/beta hydrolase [Anaerolinea sp.]